MDITTKEKLADKSSAVPPPRIGRIGGWRLAKERIAHNTMRLLTLITCGLVVVVIGALLYRAWPLFAISSLWDLLRGREWLPSRGLFGYAPFIVGSVTVTAVAMFFICVPAIFSGIYLAEYTTRYQRIFLRPILDVLVGIPSVVYGLWGVLFIVPLIRDVIGPWSDATLGQTWVFFSRTNPSGYGLLAGGFVLAVMVFPFIVSVTEEVLRSIPREAREAALCVGATHWEATKMVVLHQGLPGIIAAVILGLSRAFGETLAVMMVVGNVAQIPRSLFDSAYPLPALIANNYGELMSVPLYEAALMGAALILLLVVLVFNVMARLIIVRLTRMR